MLFIVRQKPKQKYRASLWPGWRENYVGFWLAKDH